MYINLYTCYNFIGVQNRRQCICPYTNICGQWYVSSYRLFSAHDFVCTGNQTVTLPLDARTNNVQLQWRALRSGEWSMDNVRIGSDALLYNLQFDIQVGDCSPPPINGSSQDHVNLEYYDGISWSLLQTDCLLQSRCLLTVKCDIVYYTKLLQQKTWLRSFERCEGNFPDLANIL